MNTRKKKTYGCVVLAGLAALLIDRLFLSEPDPVAAADPPAAEAPRPDAPLISKTTNGSPSSPAVVVAAAPFPRDLPAYEPTGFVRDVFTLTPISRNAMLGLGDPRASDGTLPGNARYAGPTIAQFKQNHRLFGVITGAGTRLAIVDEQRVRVGQSVDGCKLVEIMGQSALFRCADGLAELKVFPLDDGG